MQPVSWKTRIQAAAGVGRPYRLYLKTSVRLRFAKKAICQSECNPIDAVVTLLCRSLESTVGHDTVIRRTWVTAACWRQLDSRQFVDAVLNTKEWKDGHIMSGDINESRIFEILPLLLL